MNIVLLPGFMTDATLWDDVLPALQAIASVTAIDFNGATTTAEMADLVLAEGPISFVLIGFSMGGYVAREVVRKSPGRVTALILVATSARGDTGTSERKEAFGEIGRPGALPGSEPRRHPKFVA